MAVVESRACDLLEREDAFATLDRARADAARGAGRLVLVSGEAGIGKTAQVREFCWRSGKVRLAGACDGLHTPRPLGPFVDIAVVAGGRLEAVGAAGKPASAVFAALVGELRPGRETVVVLEDVHRADEATLDLLGLLGRRVERLGTLVLVTYRDDELGRVHSLRVLLGDLATTDRVMRDGFWLGVYPGLTPPMLDFMVDTLRSWCRR